MAQRRHAADGAAARSGAASKAGLPARQIDALPSHNNQLLFHPRQV
jgi:hypothetical protein